MVGGEEVNDISLNPVGVLVFVHQDVLKPLSVEALNLRKVKEEPFPVEQQVIKVHEVELFFPLLVVSRHHDDLINECIEERVAVEDDFINVPLGVEGETDDVLQNVTLGEPPLLGLDLEISHAGIDQVFGVLLIHDGEVALIADELCVVPEDKIPYMVEGASPYLFYVLTDEQLHPVEHLLGRPVRKGDQEDMGWINAGFDQPGYAVGDCPGLPAPGAGNDQDGPAACHHHFELFRIKLRFVADKELRWNVCWLEGVALHGKLQGSRIRGFKGSSEM